MIIDNIIDVITGNNGYVYESIGKFVSDIANIVRNYCIVREEKVSINYRIEYVKKVIERVN